MHPFSGRPRDEEICGGGEVAKAFDRDVKTLRSWERRLKAEFGDVEVVQQLEIARDDGNAPAKR